MNNIIFYVLLVLKLIQNQLYNPDQYIKQPSYNNLTD